MNDFPPQKREELKPALDSWRMPYWDWALRDNVTKELIIPELLEQNTVSVLRPSGLTETIGNPLLRYAFPMNDGKIDGITDSFAFGDGIPVSPNVVYLRCPITDCVQFSTAPYTVRQPPAYDDTKPMSAQAAWAQGISNNAQVQDILNNSLSGHAGTAYGLFAATRSYPSFATAQRLGFGDNSVEGLHNVIHREIGGSYGHMSDFDVAGFDPIFWMHHG